MKIIKPLRMSCLQRPYRWQQQDYLGIAALTLLDMGAQPGLFSEQDLWKMLPQQLQSPDGVPDMAIPKACAEFLASGYAWTRHQPDKTRCCATIEVGSLRKQLVVSGDRVWRDNRPGLALPFDSIPLDWRHAFGGEAYAENPLGIGLGNENGQALPNIESPQQSLTEPGQSPLPAGFNALSFTTPRRHALMGKNYDEHWLQNEYPGFALDTDWRVFNQAEQDQWFREQPQLPAGARWRIENMHPEKPVQQGTLPPWQARCFITRAGSFEEILLRATTVHFFPHLEQMMLIWHGSAAINEDDASDIDSLMLALELKDNPRDILYYQQIYHLRCDDEDAVLTAMRDQDLIDESIVKRSKSVLPEASDSPAMQNTVAGVNHQREEFRKRMEQQGHPVDETMMSFTPPSAPDPHDYDNLPEIIKRKQQEGDELFDQMLNEVNKHQENSNVGIPEDDELPSGIENYHLQRTTLASSRHLQGSSDEKIEKSQQAIYDNYRFTAHKQNTAQRLSPEESQTYRTWLSELMVGDKDASGHDFTGADLSGLDLRGANFENALLENTDFSHCQLEGCNFTNAVLVRAEFHHSIARSCLFDGANLSLAQCCYSDFTGCGFKEVECEDTQFEHCIFNHAQLADLLIREAYIRHCRFHQAVLENCNFMDLHMSDLDFSDALLRSCNFIRCQLDSFSFRGITATGISLLSCQAEKVDFSDALMKHWVFVSETSLQQARFNRASLTECNFRDQQLQQAIFDQAQLDNCDLSGANCQQASMQLMRTHNSRFVRTILHFADLRGSLLLGADLQKSELQGCDLSDCNLFRADLSQTITDGDTRFEESLIEGMKTVPRRKGLRV
ncbi:hypothetical protein HA49_18070 [Tatumella morbirosei]|uniref:DUF2169 domain-containing protein n=1 Tax=Tatumella morbirosei TaxID=642227 RepID=A0A095UDU4_9GAMM|nr:DUF2169 domain-containing protein [Tatumella morbirosei]KGD72598.1 hypothetical protein HA49_18070 [Tatumella morbirosei]